MHRSDIYSSSYVHRYFSTKLNGWSRFSGCDSVFVRETPKGDCFSAMTQRRGYSNGNNEADWSNGTRNAGAKTDSDHPAPKSQQTLGSKITQGLLRQKIFNSQANTFSDSAQSDSEPSPHNNTDEFSLLDLLESQKTITRQLEQLSERYNIQSMASLKRVHNERKLNILQGKIYHLEETGSNAKRISMWLGECVRLSRENRDFSMALLYVDRLLEKHMKRDGPTSHAVGRARLERARILALLQDWTGCLTEIIQVLSYSSMDGEEVISRDRFTCLLLGEMASRQMPPSFHIPWAPRFDLTDPTVNPRDNPEIVEPAEDGIMYLPPLDQWYNIILDHFKFTAKELGFQQYKPYVLQNAAWLISRRCANLNNQPETLFDQLPESAYVDIVDKEQPPSEETVKDISHSIKYNQGILQYFQKRKAGSSLLGDIEYNIALSNFRIGQAQESIDACQRAIRFYNQAQSAELDLARACHLLALSLKTFDLAQALHLVKSSLDLVENVDQTRSIEYLQFLYTYFVLVHKMKSDARSEEKNSELYKERLQRATLAMAQIDAHSIADYFIKIPISLYDWSDFTAQPKLIVEKFAGLWEEIGHVPRTSRESDDE